MKKLLKILIGLVVIFLVVIVAIAVVGGIMADRVAKSAIETGASYALGVETTVDKVDVQFTKLSVNLDGLHIANPEGFDKSFLELGSAGVSLNSLTGSVLTVPVLSIHNIDMNLLKNDKGSNYKIILDNLKRFESSETSGTPSTSADEGLKFVIQKIDIQNVKVHLELTPIGGQLTAIDVDLDKIELQNVGSAGKPVGAGDIIGIMVKAILSAAINKGGDLIPGDMLGGLQDGLAGVGSLGDMGISVLTDVGGQLTDITGDLTKNIGKGASDAAADATDKVKKGLEGVGKGIGKALKNPFDKKEKNKDNDGG